MIWIVRTFAFAIMCRWIFQAATGSATPWAWFGLGVATSWVVMLGYRLLSPSQGGIYIGDEHSRVGRWWHRVVLRRGEWTELGATSDWKTEQLSD